MVSRGMRGKEIYEVLREEKILAAKMKIEG
jgi:hypothetical protein